MRLVGPFLCVLLACSSDASVACERDVDALAELEGARRHGCLDPAVLPSWAAVPSIESLAVLDDLIVPFDAGEGRWLKFVLDTTAEPRWSWFINGAVFGPHWELTRAIGCESDVHEHRVLGELGFRADRLDENGNPGRFYFAIDGNPPADFDDVVDVYQVLRDRVPIAADLTYVPGDETQRELYDAERGRFDAAPFEVELSLASDPDEGVAVLNEGVAYGRLRRMSLGEIPAPTDIPVYAALPNDLPLVAGVITTTPQTALAHVNLRAVQDGIPNAFVPPSLATLVVEPLLDRWVRMAAEGLTLDLREASEEEVDRHFANRRPQERQRPRRDLRVDDIRALSEVGFEDAAAFGVKSANLGELHRIGLEAFVPDGVAVPLAFYVRFMEATGLDDFVDDMLDDARFRSERSYREDQLAELRDRIERATMPMDLHDALGEAQAFWPLGTSLRCRSSTNAEDLPDFNGAGLYESYTQRPDEGHIRKSVQQVYASLWTTRAFEQREFHRIDHRRVAMGVTIHPNFEGERVNGVAVSDDVLYQWREGIYYVNAQVGEDLVTNPEPGSVPDELYLTPANPSFPYFVIRRSSLAEGDALLMSDDALSMLARDLDRIHAHFAELYRTDGRFAMEIELKITADGILAIKQARPWVYGPEREVVCR